MKLRIIDSTGHTELDTDELTDKEVERRFKKLIGEGFVGFSIDPLDRTKGEYLGTKFDPQAKEIILRPPLVGG